MKREIKAGNFFHDIEPRISSEDLEAAQVNEEEARDELSRLFKELAENTEKREKNGRKSFFEGCGDPAYDCGGCRADCEVSHA